MTRLLAIAVSCWAFAGFAATSKFALAIGSNVGDPEDTPLQFAHDDAQRFVSVLVELGGVDRGQATVLLEQPAAAVEVALRDLAARVQRAVAAGDEVVVYVYVSAHAKAGVLHLANTHLPIERLQQLTDTAAQLEVVVVDACESGSGVARKGGVPQEAYLVELGPKSPRGEVFIASSGPAEPAQEWVSLRGSLFTHHLLAGLRGDADLEGDGRVTLSEAYAYAYRRTVVGATSSAQHPSFELALEGAGELVLTEPGRNKSALLFPPSLEGRFVIASQPRPDVVMELDKRAGQPVRLAVPPGRYRVLKRLGRLVGLVDVELPFGGEASVDETSMVRRAHVEVATKGSFELRPAAVMVLGSIASQPLESTGLRWSGGAAFRWSSGEWWLLAGLGAGAVSFRGQQLTAFETQLTGLTAAGYRLAWNPVMPMVGGFIAPKVLSQRFVRDDEEAVQRVLRGGAIPSRTTFGISFGALIGAEIPLPANFMVLVLGRLEARWLPAVDQPTWTVGAGLDLGVGWRF